MDRNKPPETQPEQPTHGATPRPLTAVLDAARAAQKAELLRLCAEAEAQESA